MPGRVSQPEPNNGGPYPHLVAREKGEGTMLGNLGWQEILLILLLVMLLFGARRIPEVMRSFGKGYKEFRKGMKEIRSDLDLFTESNDK